MYLTLSFNDIYLLSMTDLLGISFNLLLYMPLPVQYNGGPHRTMNQSEQN